jgi:hypothetical protein
MRAQAIKNAHTLTSEAKASGTPHVALSVTFLNESSIVTTDLLTEAESRFGEGVKLLPHYHPVSSGSYFVINETHNIVGHITSIRAVKK